MLFLPSARSAVLRAGRITAAALLFALQAGCGGVTSAGPPKEPAAALLEQCRNPDLAKERACYSAVFDARLASEGPAPVLALLDRLAVLDPDVRRDGHHHAHRIGISALKSPADVGRVFATCTPAHQSGCYHGVIQAYFIAMEKAGGGVNADSVEKLCTDYRGKRADLLFQCTHGLGHGLAILKRHDLPKALGSCDLLARGPEREMCYAGAFMESVVNATHPGPSVAPAAASAHGGHGGHGPASAPAPAFKAIDPADMHYPCSILPEKYLIACYTIQTSAMLHHARNDIAPVAAECGRAPEKARPTCFLSLGRDVSTVAAGSTPEAVRLCGLADAKFRPMCHRGVVEALVNMNASPAEGIPYCKAVQEAASKRKCYETIGLQALVLPDGEAKRAEACRGAEADMRDVCLSRPAATGGA